MDLRFKFLAINSFIKAKLFKKRIPIALSWAVTYSCNYRCKYCNNWNIKIDEISTLKSLEIIDKLKKLRLQRINFTGGEPLLRDDIGQLISYAKEKGIEVCLNSNGSLVPNNIDKLKDLNMLILSIEGPEKIHDFIREKGSFQSVIAAAEFARDNNLKIRFSATLNKYNFNYVRDLVLLAKKFNTSVTFQPINLYFKKNRYYNDLLLDRKSFVLTVKNIINYKQSKYRCNIGNSMNGLNYILNWPNLNHIDCAFGKIFFRIEPDGNMYPCSQNISKENSVDVVNLTIGEIKRSINNLKFNFNCCCGCSNRVEANLIWNMKLNSIYEIFNI